MSIRQDLLKARSYLTVILGFILAFGIVLYVEKNNKSTDMKIPQLQLSENFPNLPAPRGLSYQEAIWARIAWQYFVNNTQTSGLVNSAEGHDYTSLWDSASYLFALISAHQLDIIDDKELDARMQKALNALSILPLYQGNVPYLYYSTKDLKPLTTTYDVNYSLVDVGRLLIVFKVIIWRYPQYNTLIQKTLSHWDLASLFDMEKDNSSLKSRHNQSYFRPNNYRSGYGYSLYAVNGLSLINTWAGIVLTNSKQQRDFTTMNGLSIPVDGSIMLQDKPYPIINSLPYILTGLENGFNTETAEISWGIIQVQESLNQNSYRHSYVNMGFSNHTSLLKANEPKSDISSIKYGELNVCIDGEITVSHSSSDGRMCTISFAFVEAGELSFPTSGVATGQKLISSTDAMADSASGAFGKSFGLDGLPDFLQNGVLENAHDMMGVAIKTLDRVNSAMGDAGRLLDGDLSVLLMPPSSGMDFTNRLQRMWRSGDALFRNSGDIISKIKGLSGLTVDRGLAPRGVWKTDSKTTQIQTEQTNAVAQAMRTTALAEAARSVSSLPQPPISQAGNIVTPVRLPQRAEAGTDAPPVKMPLLTHPAVTSLDDGGEIEPPLSYDTLTEIRDTLNNAIDQELLRVTDDALFLALNTVRADVNRDISQRLEQTEKTALLTPTDVVPALVLAADWYDSAARERDIIGRNPITHPGFVPVATLKVPVR